MALPVTDVVDKYGRKVAQTGAGKELKRFYKLDQDEAQSDAENAPVDEEEQAVSEEEYDPARGIGVVDSSDSEDLDDLEGGLNSDEEQDLTAFELQTLVRASPALCTAVPYRS